MDSENNDLPFVTTEEAQDLSFHEIKKVATQNIGALLKDLQDFEEAINQENIQDIYRIYNGRLNKELRENSNKNHEIDELLSSKIHESLIRSFPFLRQATKESPSVFYYQVDQYYRQRATIYLDSNIPELYIFPEILEEWQSPQTSYKEELNELESKMDEIEAKKINAKIAVGQLDAQLHALKLDQTNIESNKSFFNRAKIDEDLEVVHRKQRELYEQRKTWMPYLATDDSQVHLEKEALLQEYEEKRIQNAVITKELRLINKHFGSVEAMEQALNSFLEAYLIGEEADFDGR